MPSRAVSWPSAVSSPAGEPSSVAPPWRTHIRTMRTATPDGEGPEVAGPERPAARKRERTRGRHGAESRRRRRGVGGAIGGSEGGGPGGIEHRWLPAGTWAGERDRRRSWRPA